MSKPLEDYTGSDSPTFSNLIHRGPNGYWKPIYPHEIGRALKHVEADYNYKLLTGSIANYRIFPAGQLPSSHPYPEDFSGSEGKFLTLKKEGTDFYWTLEEVSTDGGGAGDQIYNSQLPPGTTMTEAHGALPQGTLVDSLSDGVKTLSELMDAILFPTAQPDLNQPSVSLSTNTSLKEVGSLHDIALDFSASRGTIVNTWGGPNQGPFAGPILSANYEQNNSGNLIPVQFSGTTLTDVTVSQYEVLEGANNKWELNVEFDNGDDPLDSTGEVVAGAAFQTQTLSDAKTFTGVWPIYLGTSSNGWEKVTDATENTGKQTSGGSTNILINNPTSNFQFSQNYGDINGGTRHRVAVHSSYISGNDFTIEERNFGAPQTGAGTWVSSDWVAGGTITFNVNSNATSETYVIMEKSGTSSGGDELRSEIGDALMCKYRIAGN